MKKKINRFEDLIAWQKARVLTSEIYKITKKGSFARDYELIKQIRKSAVSIMSNLAEGFERGKVTEFHQFISIAKGSCAEVRCQLYIAKDAEHIDNRAFSDLMKNAEEVGRIIGGLRKAVGRKRYTK